MIVHHWFPSEDEFVAPPPPVPEEASDVWWPVVRMAAAVAAAVVLIPAPWLAGDDAVGSAVDEAAWTAPRSRAAAVRRQLPAAQDEPPEQAAPALVEEEHAWPPTRTHRTPRPSQPTRDEDYASPPAGFAAEEVIGAWPPFRPARPSRRRPWPVDPAFPFAVVPPSAPIPGEPPEFTEGGRRGAEEGRRFPWAQGGRGTHRTG